MSRIGKQPISIPAKVKIDIDNKGLKVAGPNGSLSMNLSRFVSVSVEGSDIVV